MQDSKWSASTAGRQSQKFMSTRRSPRNKCTNGCHTISVVSRVMSFRGDAFIFKDEHFSAIKILPLHLSWIIPVMSGSFYISNIVNINGLIIYLIILLSEIKDSLSSNKIFSSTFPFKYLLKIEICFI